MAQGQSAMQLAAPVLGWVRARGAGHVGLRLRCVLLAPAPELHWTLRLQAQEDQVRKSQPRHLPHADPLALAGERPLWCEWRVTDAAAARAMAAAADRAQQSWRLLAHAEVHVEVLQQKQRQVQMEKQNQALLEVVAVGVATGILQAFLPVLAVYHCA